MAEAISLGSKRRAAAHKGPKEENGLRRGHDSRGHGRVPDGCIRSKKLREQQRQVPDWFSAFAQHGGTSHEELPGDVQ